MNLSLKALAAALGGEVASNQVRAPGPGHSPKDRSLAAWLAPDTLDGLHGPFSCGR